MIISATALKSRQQSALQSNTCRSERHVILPLDLAPVRRFGADRRYCCARRLAWGRMYPSLMCLRAIWCFFRSRWLGQKQLGPAICSSGSMRSLFGHPDCRPEFIGGFQDLARIATKIGNDGGTVRVHWRAAPTPKAKSRKKQPVGSNPGASWSCWTNLLAADGRACGVCDSCRLRRVVLIEPG